MLKVSLVGICVLLALLVHAQDEIDLLDENQDEDSPVSEESTVGQKGLTTTRPWQATDFSKQTGSIGYTTDAFSVPKGLEIQYNFWIDIYSKYSTDQGLIHDSENIDLIYEVLDFNPIMTRSNWNVFRKDIAKKQVIKNAKQKWIQILKNLKN